MPQNHSATAQRQHCFHAGVCMLVAVSSKEWIMPKLGFCVEGKSWHKGAICVVVICSPSVCCLWTAVQGRSGRLIQRAYACLTALCLVLAVDLHTVSVRMSLSILFPSEPQTGSGSCFWIRQNASLGHFTSPEHRRENLISVMRGDASNLVNQTHSHRTIFHFMKMEPSYSQPFPPWLMGQSQPFIPYGGLYVMTH